MIVRVTRSIAKNNTVCDNCCATIFPKQCHATGIVSWTCPLDGCLYKLILLKEHTGIKYDKFRYKPMGGAPKLLYYGI